MVRSAGDGGTSDVLEYAIRPGLGPHTGLLQNYGLDHVSVKPSAHRANAVPNSAERRDADGSF